MQIYLVGGAVRDTLLGLPVTDRDWVVVGSSPQEMTAKGFLSVGKDFPVFLHPVTKEEYALARTERKTAPGYHGFVFDTTAGVTLEQDLARRDITINSIAQDSTGQLIDPFGGQSDLAHKVLRHTSPAFAEDPVRDEIRNYCETDVANTYLVFARFQMMRGVLTRARYKKECELVRGELVKLDQPHWKEFLAAWPEQKT